MFYVLIPVRYNIFPKNKGFALRIVQIIKPWGMLEVFMLGILVSLIKLTDDFEVIIGVSLWSFGGLTLLLTLIATTFNPKEIWDTIYKVEN